MVATPADSLSEADQAVIDRILSAPGAWVALAAFPDPEADAAAIAELVDRGWLAVWEEWTPDGKTREPSVTLTPWGAEQLGVEVREHRAKVTCEEEVEGPGGRKLTVVRLDVVDDVPYWTDPKRPERSPVSPRYSREVHMSIPRLEDCLWRMTRHEAAEEEAPKILGAPVQSDRRLG